MIINHPFVPGDSSCFINFKLSFLKVVPDDGSSNNRCRLHPFALFCFRSYYWASSKASLSSVTFPAKGDLISFSNRYQTNSKRPGQAIFRIAFKKEDCILIIPKTCSTFMEAIPLSFFREPRPFPTLNRQSKPPSVH